MRRPITVAVLLVITAALVACGSSRRGIPVSGPMAFPSAQVALGERAFMETCNACHPSGAAGLAPGINNKSLPEFLIKFQVRNGIGAMPAFSEQAVTPEELDAIVEYLEYMRNRPPPRG